MRKMSKVIALDKPDGTVRIRNFNSEMVDELVANGSAATEEEAMIILSDSSARGGANPVIVEYASLPYYGNFRNAWKRKVDGSVEMDMAKARTIKTDRVRVERDERLRALDVNYIRADEVGDTAEKSRIAALKQQLRDLPSGIQTAISAISNPKVLDEWEPNWP